MLSTLPGSFHFKVAFGVDTTSQELEGWVGGSRATLPCALWEKKSVGLHSLGNYFLNWASSVLAEIEIDDQHNNLKIPMGSWIPRGCLSELEAQFLRSPNLLALESQNQKQRIKPASAPPTPPTHAFPLPGAGGKISPSC